MHLTVAVAVLSLVSASTASRHLSAFEFREAIAKDDTLVAFVELTVQPSLESTKKLESLWTAVGEQGFSVASVDCAKEASLCDELDVASYPAIRLFHSDGQVRRYRGPRRSHDIAAFVRRSQRPALSSVDSSNATAFSTSDDIVFIAGYSKIRDTYALPDRFADLARAYSDRYSFAVSLDSAATPSVTCYNTIDGEQHTVTDLAMTAALDNFVKLCASPIVVELTRRSELTVFASGKSLVHFFYRGNNERRSYTDIIRPLAKAYREYLTFTTVDADEYGDDMMMSLGLAGGHSGRALAVQNPANGDVFPYSRPEEISAAAVEKFLIDITQGIVKPWSSSAPSHDEL